MANNCLNCGKEIAQKNGGKERKFCDNNNACKQAYHNNHKKEKKYVQFSSFQELQNKLNEAEIENKKLLAKVAENNKPENKAKLKAERNGLSNDTKEERMQPLTPQETSGMPIKIIGESALDFLLRKAHYLESLKK